MVKELVIENFLHTNDVVKAFDLILRKGENHQIYNIGSSLETTIKDLAIKLVQIFKKPGNAEDWIEHVPDRAFNDCRYMVDSDKLHQLGWFPNMDFDTLLKETVDWYLNNLDYWGIDVNSYLQAHPLVYQQKEISFLK